MRSGEIIMLVSVTVNRMLVAVTDGLGEIRC